ncbi:MAG: methyltransferase domain-containing protein [Gemmatimonadota bacterium]|nr:MAG: methyltransferase domain-containing protein [Gemmatimonadota bacterium]
MLSLNTDFWVTDNTAPGAGYRYAVSKVLVWKKTNFQDLAIVDTPVFGRALLLDGNWQSSVSDEFLYHEPLVHPAMLWHGKPRKVAILGGGEGATLREVLRWKTVDKAVMVDLDGEVVEACKTHLPEMHQGSFGDLRAELVIGDARDWLQATDEKYDVVISDLSEPLEHGPAYELFTKEYFLKVREVLKPDGYLALQAGSVAPQEIDLFARVCNTVAAVFEHARPYASMIPSFAAPWGFVLASSQSLDSLPDPNSTDRTIAELVGGTLRMLDGEALHGLFMVSGHVRRAIERESRVYTIDHPPQR